MNDYSPHKAAEGVSRAAAPISATSSENLLLGVPEVQLEQRALAALFRDYCIVSTNRLLSRGYLDGLESLLTRAYPSSDVSQAVKGIALISFAKKLSMSDLLHKAKLRPTLVCCALFK